MTEGIIIAIIGFIATILAAVITCKRKGEAKHTNIKQSQKGNHNTQIGIQVNRREGDDEK